LVGACHGPKRTGRGGRTAAFKFYELRDNLELRSTNPLERLNREIGPRTGVVGIFPNDRALIRLAACVTIEQKDEWLVGRRYLAAGSMEPLLDERLQQKAEEVLALQAA
jgi:transposase-like protein